MSHRAWGLVLVIFTAAATACSFDLAEVDTGATPGDDGGGGVLVDGAPAGDDGGQTGGDGGGTGTDATTEAAGGDAGQADAPGDAVAIKDTAPLDTGVDAPGPTRVTSGLLALYTFKEGAGAIVHDTSGVVPTLDVTVGVPANTTWTATGLRIDTATVLLSSAPAVKVASGIAASNQLTLEAWITPSSLTTQFASGRLIDCGPSGAPGQSNFDLAQVGSTWGGSLKLGAGNTAITPGIPVTLARTHFVLMRDALGAWTAFINGTSAATGNLPGTFANFWDTTTALLALGNSAGSARPFLGTLHLAALYSRALSAAEVKQNYNVGP
jgi:hypothetical protein